ncbi:hypothetical protein [Pseudomonas sp.]|uniref:hypothetical protein n=1 Tax=Pseudomonas sp. TaxID=306 RepID=UPI0028AB898C|nr:hypothetical protein [Pseudomonas sp.]
MPTENRSSNTEMVSVPRKLLETIRSFHWSQQDCNDLARAKSRAELIEILTKPAPQHQGEPVGALLIDEYFDNREVGEVDVQLDSKVCEQLAEKYPGQSLTLYINPAPADPGEVERLRADLDECDGDRWKLRTERNTLRAQLAERDVLLRDINKRHSSGVDFDLPADLAARVKAISASAAPSAPGKQGAPLAAVRAPEIQDLLDRAATAIGQYGDSLLDRGQREACVDLLDLEREVRDLEQEFRGAFAQPCT